MTAEDLKHLAKGAAYTTVTVALFVVAFMTLNSVVPFPGTAVAQAQLEPRVLATAIYPDRVCVITMDRVSAVHSTCVETSK